MTTMTPDEIIARITELERDVGDLRFYVIELERENECLRREVAIYKDEVLTWRDRCWGEQEAHAASVRWFDEQLRQQQDR